MDPRKATASVSYNGKRIDTKLAEYLQSFTYTDVASGESDSLSLNINDRDRKWIKSWFPSKGDTMAATIIMKNWSKEGDTQKLSCGSFWNTSQAETGSVGTSGRQQLQGNTENQNI